MTRAEMVRTLLADDRVNVAEVWLLSDEQLADLMPSAKLEREDVDNHRIEDDGDFYPLEKRTW